MSLVSSDSSDTAAGAGGRPSRYESQKRRDWHTFGEYLRNHRPPLELARCSGAHILEFLRYLDQFGKTKVHAGCCPFFGHRNPPAPCPCPLRQAWGSLDALVGRLRAAFEENGGCPDANPFGARAVRLYLREVRDTQAKARGIAYEKKRKRSHYNATASATVALPNMNAMQTSHASCCGVVDAGGGVYPCAPMVELPFIHQVNGVAEFGMSHMLIAGGGVGDESGEGGDVPDDAYTLLPLSVFN